MPQDDAGGRHRDRDSEVRGGTFRYGPVRITFVDASSETVAVVGTDKVSWPTHFFLGNDPARWVSDVRGHRRVEYRGLYDGIDASFTTSGSGLKYEFRVRPSFDEEVRRRFTAENTLLARNAESEKAGGEAGAPRAPGRSGASTTTR